jgi:predicted acyl esterase
LEPNPALKAVSEQASPVDQRMNDDFHRYGALRESYAFEYSVMEQPSKTESTHFKFNQYDTYQWYLNLGPLTNANAEYLHGTIPFWNSVMEHPNYDAFWKCHKTPGKGAHCTRNGPESLLSSTKGILPARATGRTSAP